MNPKLSIIVLAYNEEAYIQPCLEAIKQQTMQPDEVILVNNNSTDKTAAIARTYPFVTLINEKEQGMIPARNAGFNRAKGNLLARIDADTRIPSNWVATAHTIFDHHSEEICGISGSLYFYEIHNPVLQKIASILSGTGYFLIGRILLRHETLYGSNMIITRNAWDKVKGEVCHDSQEVHEDIDLAIHIGSTALFFSISVSM